MIWDATKKLFYVVVAFSTMMTLSCSNSDQQQEEQLETDQQQEAAEFQEGQEEVVAEGEGMEEGVEADPLANPLEEEGVQPFSEDGGQDEAMSENKADSMTSDSNTMGEVTGNMKYIVKPGDSLSKIAGKIYGNIMEWKKIHEASPEISNPNVIHPGQMLNVPLNNPMSSEFASKYEGQKSKITITVQKGDTLGKIAQRALGNSKMWRQIWNENNSQISNPHMIEVGQSFMVTIVAAH